MVCPCAGENNTGKVPEQNLESIGMHWKTTWKAGTIPVMCLKSNEKVHGKYRKVSCTTLPLIKQPCTTPLPCI